jgi:hypothetical protein
MTATPIDRLIAEAVVLAGGEHQCAILGHRWKSIGGRACPFYKLGCGNASQAVHECESCGDVDYGERAGEPGFDYCAGTHFNCGGAVPDDERAALASATAQGKDGGAT